LPCDPYTDGVGDKYTYGNSNLFTNADTYADAYGDPDGSPALFAYGDHFLRADN
jgi:hypothetical protein